MLFPLGLVAIALLLYGQTLSSDFLNWDDNQYITQSTIVQQLSMQTLGRTLTSIHFSDYLPLNTFLLALWHKLWGLWAPGYRIVNLALHVLNATLVFGILAALLRRRWLAAIGAILFLVHPVQVETVAWISEHKALLSAALLLGAMRVLVRGGPRWALLLLGFLAMCAKAVAVVIPAIIFAFDLIVRRRTWRQSFFNALPLALLAAAMTAFNLFAQSLQKTIAEWNEGALVQLWRVTSLPGRYIATLIWPVDLSPLYRITFPLWPTAAYVAITAALLVVGISAIRRQKLVSFGIAWFFILWLPVANLVPMVIWFADRYLYLPLVGILLALLAPLRRIQDRRAIACILIVALAIATALSIATHRQARHWRSNLELWSYAAPLAPIMPTASLYANALLEADRYDEAIHWIDKAIERDPNMLLNHIIRGEILYRDKKPIAAAESFSRAVELSPEDSKLWYFLGKSWYLAGIIDRAIPALQASLDLNPDQEHIDLLLGTSLADIGRIDEGRAHLKRALRYEADRKHAETVLATIAEQTSPKPEEPEVPLDPQPAFP